MGEHGKGGGADFGVEILAFEVLSTDAEGRMVLADTLTLAARETSAQDHPRPLVRGGAHIDQRREASLGAAWGPMKLTTSVVPFAAVLAGRTAVDWRGIGWWRPLLGLVVFAALLHLHRGLIGVSPLPPL